jgi:two-component system sensor histidine kinase CreC
MSIRKRIFAGILLVVGAGFFLLLDWMVDDLEPQYRKATEDPLVDSARVLASVASETLIAGEINTALFRSIFDGVDSQPFRAQIYDFVKTTVDYRVYLTDAKGIVVFDSNRGADEGMDYSGWRDVSMTLAGDYGARTSRDVPDNPNFSVMYVAAPVMHGKEVVGVISVGKPTQNTNAFTEKSKTRIVFVGLGIFLLVIVVSVLVANHITKPIDALTAYAQKVRDGKRGVLG